MTKKQKVGTFFLGILPTLAAALLQIIVSIPLAEGAVGAAIIGSSENFGAKNVLELFYELISSQPFLELTQLLYAITAVVFFAWWFFRVFREDHGPLFKTRQFSLLLLLGMVLLMIGLQFAVTIVYNGVAYLLPSAAETYEELVEMAGFDEPSVLTIVYGVLIGPIAEELIFRGVTLHYFRRIMPFALANLLQAVLFGVYHMNLMQGIYAAVAGLVFGYIMYRGGSLIYSIVSHMIFNLFGFTNLLYIGSESPYYDFICMPVMVLTLILGCMLYFGRMEKNT